MGSVFTAFPATVDRLGLHIEHLVHIGAHRGEEMPYYREADVRHVTLVEPIPELAERLRNEHPDVTVIEAACGSHWGRATLHVPRRTNMATLAAPQRADGRTRPIEVQVATLAQIQAVSDPPIDAAVIDAQGRELDVLESAIIGELDLVIVETCTAPDPTIAADYDDVAAWMSARGFTEADRWVRDQDWVTQWARGPGQPARGGEIRDVVYIREDRR